MITGQVKIQGNDIYISTGLLKKEREINYVFEFREPQPTMRVFENKKLSRKYRIETPDLTGQFFHSTIRVLKNSAVMINGIISKDQNKCPSWKDENYEAIRLQPFFLSDNEQENKKLKGAGLFQRGLHFSGTITPKGVRVVCICDCCQKSFTLQHFHAGFSEVQYFYSADSKKTLIVPYGQIEKMHIQLQEIIDYRTLELVEEQLPKSSNGNGSFKYYNSFRCPHCGSPFIDFEKNKDIRPKEYYGNYLINQELERLKKEN
jgi:hypothetical protein